MPDPVATFMNQIRNIEMRLLDDLKKIASRLDKLTDIELVRIVRELDFFQELLDRGYTNAVNGLLDTYNEHLENISAEAVKRGIRTIKGATVDQLQLLQDLETENLLGKAADFANDLKDGLFKGIVSGERPSDIVGRLTETINLETHQLNVAVHDGIRQFDDLARHKVFEEADVLWVYIGPLDDVTRDVCKATLTDERNETGWKESEVIGATNTPFGERGGFNCRHSWFVI